jgi:hypothetical protein
MEELHGVFISTVEAAEMMGKNEIFIAQLCQRGKLAGVRKFGKSWLIPLASVESYTPGKRGPKPKKAKLAEEMEGIRAELADTAQVEADLDDTLQPGVWRKVKKPSWA